LSRELEEREYFRFYKLSSSEKRSVVERLQKLLSAREEVLLAVLFGSFTGNSTFRDIDVALYVVGVDDYLKYKIELDQALTDSLGYPVDTSILNNAPPWFIVEVCESGQLLLSKIEDFYDMICKKGFGEQYDIDTKLKLLKEE